MDQAPSVSCRNVYLSDKRAKREDDEGGEGGGEDHVDGGGKNDETGFIDPEISASVSDRESWVRG